MLKDEQNRSYNGGGDAIPLKIWSDFSSLQYIREGKEREGKDTITLRSNEKYIYLVQAYLIIS